MSPWSVGVLLCPVVSMQHRLFFALFYLYSKCRWWRKVLHFPPVKNWKETSLSSERNPITLAEISIKTVQRGRAEIENSEWRRWLIHRRAYMKQRGLSEEHANCKRKSSSCMRRLSKYKQKLDNWCIDVKHKVKGFYWIKK